MINIGDNFHQQKSSIMKKRWIAWCIVFRVRPADLFIDLEIPSGNYPIHQIDCFSIKVLVVASTSNRHLGNMLLGWVPYDDQQKHHSNWDGQSYLPWKKLFKRTIQLIEIYLSHLAIQQCKLKRLSMQKLINAILFLIDYSTTLRFDTIDSHLNHATTVIS